MPEPIAGGGDLEVGPRRRGRPAVSSRHEIERTAMRLFLRDGYGETTIPAIAAACGMGRSSFFRYFASKSDIVWLPFEEHLSSLADRLAQPLGTEAMPRALADRVCAALGDAIDEDGVWMDRFAILDTVPELAAEEADRWIRWAGAVSAFVAMHRPDAGGVLPQTVGGAVQATYLAVLRQWVGRPEAGQYLLPEMHRELVPVLAALDHLLGGPDEVSGSSPLR